MGGGFTDHQLGNEIGEVQVYSTNHSNLLIRVGGGCCDLHSREIKLARSRYK
jgi:hypothetical protein